MRAFDFLYYAAGSLRGHRLRTVLTLLGTAVGVAAVILLTALGEGARRYVRNEFAAVGSNLLIVLPGKIETSGAAPIFGGTPRDVTLADAEALVRRSPRVRRVAPISLGQAPVGYRERERQTTVIGSTPDLLAIRRLAVGAGRFLPDVGTERGGPVCVIGRTIQRELFRTENPLGKTLHIGDWRFRVIGVMADKGESLGMDMDDVVIIPVATGLRVFNRTSLFRILVEVRTHEQIQDARRDVIAIFMQRHEGEEDVTVITQDSVLSSLDKLLITLTFALGGIAAVSLAVAGLGVMNVMLVAVSERTSEIGLLKALGATRGQIGTAFLAEAALLSSAGGAIGLAVGYAGAGALGRIYPALPATPPPWAVVSAVVLSAGVGLIFGVVPALRASRLDPVAALGRR
ncbi:MAG: ABC transporter permease [Acidobacteriota bacterium]|nr:ABC transporter permease [Acidobacteriota bacterium]